MNYIKGGQIFDDALCGGGDTGEGYPNTAVPISAGAVAAIKAAIFMGDPRNIHGLSYNVGTCTAQGVSIRRVTKFFILYRVLFSNFLLLTSLTPVQLASFAPARLRFSPTVMPQTHTAATETTQTLTKVMARSMASKPSLLSTASSPRVVRLPLRPQQQAPLPPKPAALLARPRLSTDSVVVSAGLVPHNVLLDLLVKS